MSITEKMIVVSTHGVIPELGYINGPITAPWRAPIEKIEALVKHGRKVYECNPVDTTERVLLSIGNYNKENFKYTAEELAEVSRVGVFTISKPVAQPAPVEEEKPEPAKEEAPAEDVTETPVEETPTEEVTETATEDVTETPVEEVKATEPVVDVVTTPAKPSKKK